MTNFKSRRPSKIEDRVSEYESLVDSLLDGYSMSIYEYINDLYCRQYLEEHKDDPDVSGLWSRIERTDSRFLAILNSTKRCICGNYPQSYFWYWSYPSHSPVLEQDLKENGML
ncbi:hypothetical protein [Gimesia aquarii]|uniref:Uncharacterized protein n=1 Tax=Gimesia aquarii TaxID=2527964 RepID=A0A517W3P9_9PLAN|nr:hypothetical protein [Gimesia aquarii]QDT99885.1 hypothetical protein V144x_53990 [Gimesia aquarii]